jgi:hypothetical protein
VICFSRWLNFVGRVGYSSKSFWNTGIFFFLFIIFTVFNSFGTSTPTSGFQVATDQDALRYREVVMQPKREKSLL